MLSVHPINSLCYCEVQGQLHIYQHSNMQHLEQLLSGCPAHMRKLVVTDSLFSMDGGTSLFSAAACSGARGAAVIRRLLLGPAGDFADLKALIDLRHKYGFLLVIDEAHATFVCGSRYDTQLACFIRRALDAVRFAREKPDMRSRLPGAVGRQRRLR